MTYEGQAAPLHPMKFEEAVKEPLNAKPKPEKLTGASGNSTHSLKLGAAYS
jgi:hypothetical protein